MTMFIVRAVWTGFLGAPGYTNFAFENGNAVAPTVAEVDQARTDLHDMLAATASELPPVVKIDIDGLVRILEPTNGALLGMASGAANLPQIVGAANLGTYTGPVGGLLRWSTNGVHGGRLVHGRTFIVPMSNEHIGGGSINQTGVGALQAAATIMIGRIGTGGVTPGIWARPRKAYTNKAGVLKPALLGSFQALVGAQVNSVPAVLRSRRD